jgi:hypothetical protein
MQFRLRTLLIVLALGLATVVASLWYSRSGIPPGTFANAALKAESTIVYEGLPHQTYERALLERERTTKDVREFHSYPFYREPLEVTKEDAKKLAVILAKPSTWRPFTGEKKCGGFHPDYAVEFNSGMHPFVVLLCFGCGEGKIYHAGSQWRFDMSQEPRELLDAYQKNRPPIENRFR